MVAEFTATIGIVYACFVDGSASNWGGADSGVAISIAAVIIYRTYLSGVRASVGDGAKELRDGYQKLLS